MSGASPSMKVGAAARGVPLRCESVGEDGLLALAGGRPVGVEGGALFLPFLGGVVDIVVEIF